MVCSAVCRVWKCVWGRALRRWTVRLLLLRCQSGGFSRVAPGCVRGIENVREVLVGSFVARRHLVVLVLSCLRAALQGAGG